MSEKNASETHWPDYYEVTAERPSWTTTKTAAEAFGEHPADGPWFAVDLGCGAFQPADRTGRRRWGTITTSTSSRSWPFAVDFPLRDESGSISSMSDLASTAPTPLVPSPAQVAMADDAPSIEELFTFAREAELRVQTLRMTIEERVVDARGAQTLSHEVQLRHPGHARVTTRRSAEPMSSDYSIWLSDGETATTYQAANRLTSRRRLPGRVAGSDGPDVPPFARQYVPLTRLPASSLAETFIHPHGLFRNVLVTGPLAVIGTRPVAGREAIVVRARHPRSAVVLVDRPDRSIDVGIARDSGFVVLLIERIGETVTRHAEVTTLELDPTLFDSAFELKLPGDVRTVY